MGRKAKLIQNYTDKLTEHGIKKPERFIDSILAVDITHGKYARFLIDGFLNDTFLEEDLVGGVESTVGKTITLFERNKARLPVEKRSYNQYKSIADMWKMVKDFDIKSGKEIKHEERDRAMAESRIFKQTDDILILSPQTHYAASWFGKNTRWCTASTTDSTWYKSYSKKSPLYIMVVNAKLFDNNKTGIRKFQAWSHDNKIVFMDESDTQLSYSDVINHHDIFKEFLSICNISLYKNPSDMSIKEKASNLLHDDICEKIIEHMDVHELNHPDVIKILKERIDSIHTYGQHISFNPIQYAFVKTDKIFDIKNTRLRDKILNCILTINKQAQSVHIFLVENFYTKANACTLSERMATWIRNDWAANFYKQRRDLQDIFGHQFNLSNLETFKHFSSCYPNKINNFLFDILFNNKLSYILRDDSLNDSDNPYTSIDKSIFYDALATNDYPVMYEYTRNLPSIIDDLLPPFYGMSRLIPGGTRIQNKRICKKAVEVDAHALRYVCIPLRTKDICDMAIKKDPSAIIHVPKKYRHHYPDINIKSYIKP